MRNLEIGPGPERLSGFETLNLIKTPYTDHIGDARRLPFEDQTFDIVYSSHCIEHLEWFEIEAVIAEWARVVTVGGYLEVHTVNAVPMLRAMLEWEDTGKTDYHPSEWKKVLHRDDPFLAAQGRILNYAKRTEAGESWKHRAILTPRYMRQCFERAGLVDIEDAGEPRGLKKHSLINMGFRGKKC